MKNIEFYRTPTGGIMINDSKGTRELKETDRNFISEMIKKIGEFYPEALADLSKTYECKRFNIPHFEYTIVSRFIRCNWGTFDSIVDIDQFGYFNFEEVECPLRGECKSENVICRPKFNSKLSFRELEVMRCYYEGCETEEIADRLCISIETVKTHVRNAFKRTSTHSMSEFILYAKNNNIFNQ